MVPKTPNAKFIILILSLSSLCLTFLVLPSTFQLKNQCSVILNLLQDRSKPFDFIAKEFKGKEIKIGLVNMDDGAREWEKLGTTSMIGFERVPKGLRWEDLFPTSIDEEETWGSPKCPGIPMPRFEDLRDFNVIVSRLPCENGGEKEGIRDVFRLQVNLVVANLVVSSSHEDKEGDEGVYVVFMGSCGPMWEIFRCDDLLKHVGEFWIYKPDLRRLKQKVLLPVGSCQLSSPYLKHVKDSTEHQREAYVTVLHSSEAYACGAITLAQSLLKTNTTKDLVLLADESIRHKTRQGLEAAGWRIKNIERIESPHAPKGAYNKWNYSKLRIWQLTEYDKVFFIDSDLIVFKNIDNFFKHLQLSAVRDSTVRFNSGVMVIEPSMCVFEILMKKRHTLFSYNGGDQGFLNEAFTWWHRLPKNLNYFKMVIEDVNMTRYALPESVYAVHYLGVKPWMCYKDYDCNWDTVGRRRFASDLINEKWWQLHDAMPKNLQEFCKLSKIMDLTLKEWREMAKNASYPDGHWKINVKDPRQH